MSGEFSSLLGNIKKYFYFIDGIKSCFLRIKWDHALIFDYVTDSTRERIGLHVTKRYYFYISWHKAWVALEYI